MAGLGAAPWLLRAYALGFFAFLLLPLAVVVLVSFASDPYITFPPSGISLRWFRAVFHEPSFVLGITNSLKLALAATAVSIVLAVPAALALVRHRFRGRDALESWLLSPLSLPLIVLGVALLFYLGRLGLGLSAFGLLAAHVVITVPYVLRTVTAVYRSADRTIEEAARVLGASPWQTFRRITLPLPHLVRQPAGLDLPDRAADDDAAGEHLQLPHLSLRPLDRGHLDDGDRGRHRRPARDRAPLRPQEPDGLRSVTPETGAAPGGGRS
jgi:ABC-type sugar transport system permease subunit